MKHHFLLLPLISSLLVLTASVTEATSFHAFQTPGNYATLNVKRTANVTVQPSGVQLNAIDFYLYHPAGDWSDESDCQTTSSISYGSNRFIDAQIDWENQWMLFGFDANHTTFSFPFQAWYNWNGQRSNHLNGLGSDFTSLPGDPWTVQTSDLPADGTINAFAANAWFNPIGNMPGGYLGALWRTQAYIMATQPSGNCTRCYSFVPAARALGLPAGIISSNTCPAPSLVFQSGFNQVTLSFTSALPHAMAAIWHESLGQWIPFDLGMKTAGFPWLNQVIEGVSPDLEGANDMIFTYYSGTGSTSVSYSASVTWPTTPVFNSQSYSLINTYTVSDTSVDANLRIMTQCTGPSFAPILPPHVGVPEGPKPPELGFNRWPNPLPAGEQLYLEMTAPDHQGDGKLQLFDVQGRLLKEEEVALNNGLTNRLWPLSLASGVYIVRFEAQGLEKTLSVIIQ